MPTDFSRTLQVAKQKVIDKFKLTEYQVGVVLGSGLGGFADQIGLKSLPYSQITGMPTSTTSGHSNNLHLGRIGDKQVLIMQGRVHGYEGYSANEIVFPTRLMISLGVEVIIYTHAVGTMDLNMPPGKLILVKDHISNHCPNPLIGPNDDSLGTRFPGMGNAYSQRLRDLAQKIATEKFGAELSEGISIFHLGPGYETPAEVQDYINRKANLTTMSTIPSIIAAQHMGVEVLDIANPTNFACGINDSQPNHEEVEAMSKIIETDLISLITGVIAQL